VCTALLRAGAPASFWGEAEAHKIFTFNNLPIVPDSESKGVCCSRRNLLEGNRRPFNLNHLMAFGTAVTCYVPQERRKGGKEPAQRRSFKGVLLGYADNMPAYRIWDLGAKSIKSVSYNFTICHEGYYPFRERTNWPTESVEDPSCFSPVIGGVLTTIEWRKFLFDDEDAQEVLRAAPDLVVDRPEPFVVPPTPPVDVVPEPVSLIPAITPEVAHPEALTPPNGLLSDKKYENFVIPPSSGLKKFLKDSLAASQASSSHTPAIADVSATSSSTVLRRSERLALILQVSKNRLLPISRIPSTNPSRFHHPRLFGKLNYLLGGPSTKLLLKSNMMDIPKPALGV
jgi:hypothetical protein